MRVLGDYSEIHMLRGAFLSCFTCLKADLPVQIDEIRAHLGSQNIVENVTMNEITIYCRGAQWNL